MNKVSFTSEPYLSSVYTSGSGGMSGTRTMLVDVDSAASFIAKSSGDQRGAIGLHEGYAIASRLQASLHQRA